MGLLENLRRYVRRRSLKRLLAKQGRPTKKAVGLEDAQTVAILFNATEVDQRTTVLKFAQQLKNLGKRVKLLGYFEVDMTDANFSFDFFSNRNLDWALRPKGEAVEHFLSQSYDLFFNLRSQSDALSEYLACLVRAGLKIGPVPENKSCYDLMIDATPGTSLGQFIQQIESLLKITNVRRNTTVQV